MHRSREPHRKLIAAVYRITCTANEKWYIGSSTDVEQRWHNHRSKLRRGTGHSPHMQRSWNKYGEGSFVFEIVQQFDLSDTPDIEARAILTECEQLYLDIENPEFNVQPLAGSHPGGYGTKHGKEKRAKQSASMRGIPFDPAIVEGFESNRSKRAKSKAVRTERIAAIKEAVLRLKDGRTYHQIGLALMDEGLLSDNDTMVGGATICRILSGVDRILPEHAANFGRKLSEEHCQKISERKKGVKRPRAQTEKWFATRMARDGFKWSETHRANQMATLAQKNKNKPMGIRKTRNGKRWEARMAAGGKNYYLGSFERLEDAVEARRQKEVELFGHVLITSAEHSSTMPKLFCSQET